MLDKLLEILKEDGVYSLTRILSFVGYLVFIIVSLYLAFTGKVWGNYGEFAFATGGSAVAQIANKFINSKYNTPPGKPGKVIK